MPFVNRGKYKHFVSKWRKCLRFVKKIANLGGCVSGIKTAKASALMPAISRPSQPISKHVFSGLCADVFLFASRSFPKRAQMFSNFCAEVLLPIVMGCTTHNYGLYDPRLWVIRPIVVGSKIVLTIGKTSPHERENMYRQRQKNASPVSPGRETIGEAVEPKSVIRPFKEYLCPLSVLWRRFLLPFLST